jgi:UDP-glucose 4-epimerase
MAVTRKSKVFVCGGAGFVGSHLVERLLADGHTVDVVDDLSTGSLANLSVARTLGGALKFHHLDISTVEFAELVGLRQPDVIFHMALLPPSATESASVLRAAPMLLSVLEAARRHRVTKVVACLPAVLVYGEVPAKYLPVKEGRKADAIGVPHVMAQTIVDLLGVYREMHDIEFTVLAMTNVYGLRQRPEDGVVAAFASGVIRNENPEIHGNGKQTRDFLYIDDAVDVLVRTITKGGGLVLNAGTGVQTTIEELWKILGAGSALRAKKLPTRPGDVQRLAVSTVRTRIQLGWSSWTSVAEGLETIRESFKR